MRTPTLVVFAFVLVAAAAQRGRRPYEGRLSGGGRVKCGPNEEHSTCKSSTCAEATCDNPTVGTICTADCREGCFCRDGFFRNSRRQCVRRNQCP